MLLGRCATAVTGRGLSGRLNGLRSQRRSATPVDERSEEHSRHCHHQHVAAADDRACQDRSGLQVHPEGQRKPQEVVGHAGHERVRHEQMERSHQGSSLAAASDVPHGRGTLTDVDRRSRADSSVAPRDRVTSCEELAPLGIAPRTAFVALSKTAMKRSPVVLTSRPRNVDDVAQSGVMAQKEFPACGVAMRSSIAVEFTMSVNRIVAKTRAPGHAGQRRPPVYLLAKG